MLKRLLLPIAFLVSGLGAAPGLAQEMETFTPKIDNLVCSPPYGPAEDAPPMSRQNTVEQVVGAGQTVTLCLTRDSKVTVSRLHCRRTEGGEESSPNIARPQGTETAPQGEAAATPQGGAPAAGAQAPGAAGRRGGDAAAGGAAGGAALGGAGMARTWTCPSGTPCFGDGGFLPGMRQPLLDPDRARFCVRYVNAGQVSHTVRADFVFSYPAR